MMSMLHILIASLIAGLCSGQIAGENFSYVCFPTGAIIQNVYKEEKNDIVGKMFYGLYQKCCDGFVKKGIFKQ